MTKSVRQYFNWSLIKDVGAYGLFWSWNLIFLAFMGLGFGPLVLPDLMTAVWAGLVPWKFVLCSIGIILIPVVAIYLGATRLRKHPRRLLALGYGVEGPLMLLLIVRFFVLQELNPAMTVFYIIAGVGIWAFLSLVLKVDPDKEARYPSALRAIGVTMVFGLGLYFSILLAFYIVPLGVEVAQVVPEILREIGQAFREMRITELTLMMVSGLIFGTLWGILLLYTATLLIGMPIMVPLVYWRGWRRALDESRSIWGTGATSLLLLVTVGICAVTMAAALRQPQQRAFAMLETPPATPAHAQELLNNQDAIRRGLTNAYLSSFRHVSAIGEVDHVSEMYTWSLDFDEHRAKSVQNWYERFAMPMLYIPAQESKPETLSQQRQRTRSGDFRSLAMAQESEHAAELYENFFDEPINRGERETVIAAARSTWDVNRAERAWQAVDDREVYLAHQEITIEEHGDWADVELYEVYQNQTAQQQEVVYYFSLPESAVLTGVWLGNSNDRDKRFVYTVATRGAAQAVYRNEVVQRRDPALLEQIGPRQYRLRIFPIPPRTVNWATQQRRGTIEEGDPLHMWLTWRVMAAEDGWAMPVLAERRNIYWNRRSTRLLNGEPFRTDAETWMPKWVDPTGSTDAVAHRIDYGNGTTVIARPAADAPNVDFEQIAVILDRSYSMQKQAAAVDAELDSLRGNSTDVDLYLTASQFRGEDPSRLPLRDLNRADLLYFGGQNAAELLIQFDDLRANDAYDAVFVLTDGTGYELSEGDIDVPLPQEPIWMVHLGGFPLGYDDETLEAIQASGGGIANSLDEAFTRMAFATTSADQTRDLVDGYLWETLPTKDAPTDSQMQIHNADDGFAAFGARRVILAEMQRVRKQLDDVEVLDELHQIAIENSIVTPYSSMIVLVNNQQRQLLEQLENQADRFEREHEDAGNTVPQAAITGVPEPEEWLLIIIAVALLGWYAYSNGLLSRRTAAQNG